MRTLETNLIQFGIFYSLMHLMLSAQRIPSNSMIRQITSNHSLSDFDDYEGEFDENLDFGESVNDNQPNNFKETDLEGVEDDEQYYDGVEEITESFEDQETSAMDQEAIKDHKRSDFLKSIMSKPIIMAAAVSITSIVILSIILVIIYIVFRIRKRDEGSYALKDNTRLNSCSYSKVPFNEIYA
ncbi:hypothetical protein GJ496_011740 [Pomphorhynchus laevis]|nr:hypothetical protein GJ496_011740 [Pomphorhynchus laevis]